MLDNTVDYIMCTYLAILPSPLKFYQLTKLIKKQFLNVNNINLKCIQQCKILLDIPEFDAAELIAPWVGDIMAEGVTQTGMRWLNESQRFLRTAQDRILQAMTDEWYLVPSIIELGWFYDAINKVTLGGKNLAERLDQLETDK